jgi:DNA polymerase-1
MAINAPIQGTESDIMKLAMVKFDKAFNNSQDVFLLFQIHDSLLFEIKTEKVKEISDRIKDIMENIIPLDKTENIPLMTHIQHGKHWGNMKDL